MKYKTGDIVLVEFPFTNLTQTKKRPALVVANNFGDNHILCQITTKKRNISTFEIPLLKKQCKGDILFDSNIYIDMLFTLHYDLIYTKLGEVDNLVIESTKAKIKELFEI